MADRWSIFIDIEGFSALWELGETDVLVALGELMRGIFRVGCLCFPRDPERLFAHQIGDGFLIVSEFSEESLERCVAIAVALMRHVAGSSGRFTKCSISEGELSDNMGCYPEEVIDEIGADDSVVPLGMGLMTVFDVMGSALVRSAGVNKISPSGPLLTMDSSKEARMPVTLPRQNVEAGLVSLDWVHMLSPTVEAIQCKANLSSPTPGTLERLLQRYCREQRVKKEWVDNVRRLLSIPGP